MQKEYQEQKTVIKWCEMSAKRLDGLDLIYHVPNEARRSAQTAAMLKASGMKSGVPDLCLPVPMHGFHGLYIEMKAVGGRVAKAQSEWLDKLNQLGYAACVCYGAEQAIKTIEDYYAGRFNTN